MYWQFMWFVLAGFVLGFVVSTLWEWFHFRRERMTLRDKRVAELEEKLQALERRQSMADIYDDNAVWLADDDVEVTVPYADMAEPEPATITASTPPRDIDLDMSVGATDAPTAPDTPENIGAYAAAAGLVAAGIAATDDDTDEAAADADITEGALPAAILAAAAVSTMAAVDAAEDADITEAPWDPRADADISEGDVPTVLVQETAFDTAAEAAADADITEGPLPAAYTAAVLDADAGDATMLYDAPYQVPPNVEPDISVDDLIEAPPLPLAADRVMEIEAYGTEATSDEAAEPEEDAAGAPPAESLATEAVESDLQVSPIEGATTEGTPAADTPTEDTVTEDPMPAPADAQAEAETPLPRPPVTSEEALQELSVEELVNLTVDRLVQAAAKEGGQSLALSPKARAELEALTAELRTAKPAPPVQSMDDPAQETAPEAAQDEAHEAAADSAPVEHTAAAATDTPEGDAPDNLFMIKGIGPAYGTRLYAAGIMTWRQVADADVEELRRIARPLANADVEAWPQRARALAEEHSRMDADYAGPVPDDLTNIQGIDHQAMFLLYKAGIVTIDQLSRTSPTELADALPSSGGATPDYAGWIERAKAHMAQENGDA